MGICGGLSRWSSNSILCPEHGVVPFEGTGDFLGDSSKEAVTLYCPACLEEEKEKELEIRYCARCECEMSLLEWTRYPECNACQDAEIAKEKTDGSTENYES